MDKYIGNKKSILEEIEQFMLSKNIGGGIFLDAFTGTTNVAQYFKQRGYDIISNDINDFCYILQSTYIKNNSFPKFEGVLKYLDEAKYKFNDDEITQLILDSEKKIKNNKIYDEDYVDRLDYHNNIIPLAKVINYLNSYEKDSLTDRELFFYNHYTIYGESSEYVSTRGTKGKRNYFSKYNSKKIGIVLEKIREWFEKKLITEQEKNILLTSLIEEVTLISNVNGTFHDFNRKKLYPNALVNMYLKPPILNISDKAKILEIFKEDANNLKDIDRFKSINKDISVLYIDPPYNFRQYSSYYHMLNLMAKYIEIEDVNEYGKNLEFVRGQNMEDDIKSDYCYKDLFPIVLKDLILGINTEHVIISYYDENNHWNHGREEVSNVGREVILDIFRTSKEDILYFDKVPYSIKRQNYQSQSGKKKKEVDELLFYAKKKRW